MELIFQMVQLIASGQISQIGANALNPVKEVSKTEKDQFCYCPEMGAEPVVEILEKKENAMNLNVHVGFKKSQKDTGSPNRLFFLPTFIYFFLLWKVLQKPCDWLTWSVLKLFDSF